MPSFRSTTRNFSDLSEQASAVRLFVREGAGHDAVEGVGESSPLDVALAVALHLVSRFTLACSIYAKLNLLY
jgi:hypothetical protein